MFKLRDKVKLKKNDVLYDNSDRKHMDREGTIIGFRGKNLALIDFGEGFAGHEGDNKECPNCTSWYVSTKRLIKVNTKKGNYKNYV